jgi:hypothetical protein
VFAGETRVRMVHEGRTLERRIRVSAGSHARIELSPALAEPPPSELPPRAAPSASSAVPPAIDSRPEAGNSLGWALVIGGSATAVIGGALVIGSSATIGTHRERLAALCAVPSGTDACATAEPGQREAAQSEVDAIATWKGVRIGGWVGLGLGAAAAGTGLLIVLDRSRPSPRARVELWPTPGGAAFAVTGAL